MRRTPTLKSCVATEGCGRLRGMLPPIVLLGVVVAAAQRVVGRDAVINNTRRGCFPVTSVWHLRMPGPFT